MLDPNVTRAISLVGLGIQTALTLLLALLFVVLSRAGTERRYFTSWKRAWIGLLAGLLALCVAFASGSHPFVQRGLNLVYQVGKTVFFLELAVGAWMFAAGPGRKPSRRTIAIPFFLVVGLSLPFLGSVERLISVQAFLAAPALGWAAWLMATTPAPRRTASSLVASQTLAAMAALWVLYFVVEMTRGAVPTTVLTWQYVFTGFNSYIDLLLETLLAFTMVLVRAQDAQRELVAAHDALEEAHTGLREKSLQDPLTGALNRRAFDEGAVLAAGGGGTVVSLDVDGLKPVNDRWGHEAGDALLKHFATAMKAQLRDSDLLYRTGGDEFVVVAPGAEAERLSARIAQALTNVAELPASGDHPAIPVVASWGAAPFASASDLAGALRAADGLMYEKKRAAKVGRSTRSGILPAVSSAS
ncbi:MAG: GGDEF domain-containing protein [Holophagales bacterium]|nr:GGDEF domain-containing protein [Holophagales bacterium]